MRKPQNETLGDESDASLSRLREGLGVGSCELSPDEDPPTSTPSRELEGSKVVRSPERSCILTRRTATRDELICLALGPDGQVHPDVRAKAPGRGAWIGVSRADLETALAKGKLKAALARAFKSPVEVSADLPDRIEAALQGAALDRLGLEARGGTLINGGERVEQACRAGKVHQLLFARDVSPDSRRKLDQEWRVGGSTELGHRHGLVIPVDRTILSMALGRENVVHVAVIDPAAAVRVSHALTRWSDFIDPDPGLELGNPLRDASLRTDTTDLLNEGNS